VTQSYAVIYSPEAEEQLVAIHNYVRREASHSVADKFVAGISRRCESLESFPHRGTPHFDMRTGLRTIPFQRRATIAYVLSETTVMIVAIAYAGQDMSELVLD
jgi:toxin ParE1/3/4